MNKNAIKKYSIWAREKLISQIIDMAYLYGIEKDKEPKKVKVVGDAYFLDDKLISKEVKFQRDKLIERINTIGFYQTIEEVAYTWFNRFIAIRYMEVNGYLPGGILVFQSIDESKKPAILRNPLKLYFLDEEDKKKISALMLESKD